MEIIKKPKTEFRCALFDFDGTLSLIRAGWQGIMIPYFVEVLLKTPNAEDSDTIENEVTYFVDILTGKQTIFQCMRLSDEVKKRGGEPIDPVLYKTEYLRRLNIHIKDRKKALRDGCDPADYLVPGSIELINQLINKGNSLYLASGTDEVDVKNEAKLLGLDTYFGANIHGARDEEITTCTKSQVLKRIISDNELDGTEILSFGDGYVEIELIADIGGYAVGVATDELNFETVNLHKRKRLLEAGASLIIPDFRDTKNLITFLFKS